MMNLFIGVICDSMNDVEKEVEEKLAEEKAWVVATRPQVSQLSPRTAAATGGEMFEDEGKSGRLANP